MIDLKHIGSRDGCLAVPIGFAFFTLCMIAASSWANSFAIRPAEARLHIAMELPKAFQDRVMEYKGLAPGEVSRFGVYGDHYYFRRWKRMCKGSERYEAMREAFDLKKGNPC